MKRALVIGASGGIGQALCAEMKQQGWQVTGLSRSADGLDVTDEGSVRHHLGALEGPFDRIIIASGALEIAGHRPEKALKHLSSEGMALQFALNTIGPALVMKHAVALLPRDEPCVMAALSARVGSIGDNRAGGWHSYRASKAALNQIIRGAAIEFGRTHRQSICVALHPGTVATPFTEKYLGRHPAVAPREAAANLTRVMDGLTPEQSGQFFDWAGKVVAW
ncbi:SDR family oxidoreductase [Roseinatronobacter bogoriensis]|uniref:C factor, cell signaling protein n=1 Tax=Roseinatronobacter bogoriensis subsp. barguzinensis TaxID=441209 RepID=A0A2K8KGP3_9RHOB|nr:MULTISPECIES: SDR family oxidoreductase [Rhodobaca]ATX66935.1 C factor, cell signaling protein [Rhodobaca barguzinensis]MBB4206419.1 NAD(P)-dependent dehydrogenase (short-subunit alcohol dehydrogenase family) [Rhodobaca bogoriensis DSM 18756]TDW41163.1 NAD(P)-dependent dehydrogenase (short-subunit alcohol dehydrogenase family) [Rhodobaca barguzinensis]TDY74659.1 NAD(P)-dependent dehydrogenase (short-subunit alcohol dehydrogenase family) [Rhodobaca bogoriensis DSM 18756]